MALVATSCLMSSVRCLGCYKKMNDERGGMTCVNGARQVRKSDRSATPSHLWPTFQTASNSSEDPRVHFFGAAFSPVFN